MARLYIHAAIRLPLCKTGTPFDPRDFSSCGGNQEGAKFTGIKISLGTRPDFHMLACVREGGAQPQQPRKHPIQKDVFTVTSDPLCFKVVSKQEKSHHGTPIRCGSLETPQSQHSCGAFECQQLMGVVSALVAGGFWGILGKLPWSLLPSASSKALLPAGISTTQEFGAWVSIPASSLYPWLASWVSKGRSPGKKEVWGGGIQDVLLSLSHPAASRAESKKAVGQWERKEV